MNLFNWLDAAATAGPLAVLNGLWPGLLVAGLAWVLVRGLSAHLNATTRYAVWTTALLLCAALMMRPYQVAPASSAAPIEPAPVATPTLFETTPAPAPTPDAPVATRIRETPVPVDVAEALAAPAVLAVPQSEVAVPAVAPELGTGAWMSLSKSWLYGLFGLWLCVALVLLSRVGYGLLVIRRLKRNSRPVPAAYARQLDTWLGRLKHPRRVQVRASDEIDMPVAVGLLHPHILIPGAMVEVLADDEVAHVLLHELAHLQRRDDWANLLQHTLSAIFFFHPGILWLGRMMRRDREFACDDWVVALTQRPHAYASCLARLAALHAQPRQYAFAAGMSNGKQDLFDRVTTVLDRHRTVSFKLHRRSYALALLLLGGCMLGATALVPAVVLLDDEHPAVATSTPDQSPVSSASVAAVASGAAVGQGAGVQVNAEAPATSATAASSATFLTGAAVASDQSLPLLAALVPASVTVHASATEGAVPALRPVSKGDLSKASWVKLLKAFGSVSSSGDKARLLREAAGKMVSDEAVLAAYLETTGTISSSGDRERALRALIDHHTLGPDAAVRYLNMTKRFSGQSDRARLLRRALDAKALPLGNETVRRTCREVVDGLSSSNRRRVSEELQRQIDRLAQ